MTQQPLIHLDAPAPAVFQLECRDAAGHLTCHEHEGEPIRSVGAACVECWATAIGLFAPTWKDGGP